MDENMGMKESIDSSVLTKGTTFLKITGQIICRYFKPGTREQIGLETIDHNMVVDDGAVEIVKWLANATAGADGMFKYMALGSGSTAAAHDQTTLTEYTGTGTYVRILATLTAEAETSSGENKVFQAVALFPSFTGGSAVREFGIFNQLAVGGTMFNRSVFSVAKDNENNDLEITYKCTVTPYTP